METLRARVRRFSVVIGLLGLVGCRERISFDAGTDAPALPPEDAGADAPPPDAPPDPPCEGPPGLYVEGSCTELAPGVRSFAPRYTLWTDGAEKDRFVYLPPGSRIDTSDPDAWVYPVGTIFWKTFSRDGLRIETRINEKIAAGTGMDAWSMRTFAWSEDQLRVAEVTDGVENALGTDHDIPPVALCTQCHSGAAVDVGIGFTAIQLNHEGSDVTLAGLAAEGWLTAPIDTTAALIPGNETVSEALGYLHVNCGTCHGGERPQPVGNPLVFWIDVGTTSPAFTGPYLTALSQPSTWSGAALRVAPGAPDESAVILRMTSRITGVQMPPVGTESPHPAGIGSVRAWINSL
jgi:hypothetical protein